MLDIKLGRNLFRKLHGGPLQLDDTEDIPPRPRHLRTQSSEVQSVGRVSSDSATDLEGKQRRGSSGSLSQLQSPVHYSSQSRLPHSRWSGQHGVKTLANKFSRKNRQSKSSPTETSDLSNSKELTSPQEQAGGPPEVPPSRRSRLYEKTRNFWSSRHKRDDYAVGHNTLPRKAEKAREIKRELEEIEQLGVVRSSSGYSGILKNHIHSHISRMSNHRLTIRNDRKKSSVLVTMDDTEERDRQMQKQQRKTAIERFFQVPSQKQRVLERLRSRQEMEDCTDAKVKKHHHRHRRHHGKKLKVLKKVRVVS